MGANQSSNANNYYNDSPDNASDDATSAACSNNLPMTTSPLSSSSTAPQSYYSHGAQQKFAALSASSQSRSPKDLFILKPKSASNAGKNNNKDVHHHRTNDETTATTSSARDVNEMDLARGAPSRSSILRSSFRRVKILNNIPPPVIPDDKFNRLSNVSLGSSGFGGSSGGGSSQESTASSDSSSASSTLSSLNCVNQAPATTTTFSSPVASNSSVKSSSTFQPENPAARKARMNLKLNIIPSNPSSSSFVNGSHDANPYGHVTAANKCSNHPRSPMASPLYNPGNTFLHSPMSGSDSVTAGYHSTRNETMTTAAKTSSASSFYPDAVINNVGCESLRSPTRSDYVELMCTTSDSRHSRSSFSSFDGSNYSSSSFNNSPNSSGQILDISAMFQSGMNDNEVLSAWLGSIGFTEYFPNFVQAGYDVPTAVRMTTEDLTAIGITKPNHRKRIRAEIARLPTVDLNFGCDVPDTAAQFLQAVCLNDYLTLFLSQNYQNIDKILSLTWEDLEEIGVKKLGHLKKLTLAIKYFRGLRRQTAQSITMEEETRRFSTSSYLSQDNGQNNGNYGADDDKSSVSRSSFNSSSSPRKDFEKPSLHQQPVLTTFQALPSPVKNVSSESAWRPRSALGRRPSPLALTPESEELCVPWNNGGGQSHEPVPAPQPDVDAAVIANGHCTLPRRRSLKSGHKSIAKIMAQVFRTDKVPSTPPSHSKDKVDSAPAKPQEPMLPTIRVAPTTTAPLASFINGPKYSPPVNKVYPTNLSRSRTPTQLEHNEFGSLSRFPPPPSPLLRDYPGDLSSSQDNVVDLEKTPTFPHRTFTSVEPVPKAAMKLPPHHQHSMPFAQDNIGTIKQRNGRNGPSMSSSTFHDPKTTRLVNGESRGGHEPDTLDEITGMLVTLTDELDEAMHQLENAAQ